MISIYSKLDAEPIETHELRGAVTIAAWLRSKAPSYEVRKSPPISVSVNDCAVDSDLWDEFTLHPDDEVSICIEPKNDTFNLFFNPIAHSKIGLLKYMMPKLPGQSNTPKGQEIQGATPKNNQAKINAVIREIAGTYKVYPDYLLPVHTYFQDKTYQWAEMLMCVGKGEYDIPSSSIQIGDTRISALGPDAEYQIFAPGADVSGVSMSEWWHSAPEVGGTSTGMAGLELNAEFAGTAVASAASYQFSGDTISIPAGAGNFPDGWLVDMIVIVREKLTYNVIEGWSDPDIISGDLSSLAPFVGMKIEIAGENAGQYTVASYFTDSNGGNITLAFDDGSQVNGLLTGSRRMAIAYRGSKYKITYVETDSTGKITAISVDRLNDMGEIDVSWIGFSFAITNDATVELDGSGVEGGWAGPFAACPKGETTTALEYDIIFPQGLVNIDNGNLKAYGVTVEIQWQNADNPVGWTSTTKYYEESTVDQVGFTETIALPAAIRPEVRIRRIGAKSTSINVKDIVQWYGLKAKLSPPASYADVTTLAVKIRGGERLSAQANSQINVIASRKIPTRSGGAWTAPVVTRSIVAWAAYVLKSMGYADADMDMASMDALEAVCAARGDYYDYAIEGQGTVKGELANAFRAGFAELTLDRGLIKPVRDQIRTVYEHMYSPQNMTDPLQRSFTMLRPDDFDGVDVEYVDGITWAKETVECRLPGDEGFKAEKIGIEGVTDRTRAWRIGMRQRRAHRYRRWNYSFTTELDALNSRYLSFCALGDDVPGYSQSAILLECSIGSTVILRSSEPFRWTDGESHVVGIRRPDGTLSGPYAATRISDYVIEIPSIDFEPDTSWQNEPPHLIFGTSTRWSYPALITSISHGADNKVSVEAMNYDHRIYLSDDDIPSP